MKAPLPINHPSQRCELIFPTFTHISTPPNEMPYVLTNRSLVILRFLAHMVIIQASSCGLMAPRTELRAAAAGRGSPTSHAPSDRSRYRGASLRSRARGTAIPVETSQVLGPYSSGGSAACHGLRCAREICAPASSARVRDGGMRNAFKGPVATVHAQRCVRVSAGAEGHAVLPYELQAVVGEQSTIGDLGFYEELSYGGQCAEGRIVLLQVRWAPPHRRSGGRRGGCSTRACHTADMVRRFPLRRSNREEV